MILILLDHEQKKAILIGMMWINQHDINNIIISAIYLQVHQAIYVPNNLYFRSLHINFKINDTQ